MSALRDELEALQARRHQLAEALASSREAPLFVEVLEHELDALEKALTRGEARDDRRTARLPIVQRVATFGFVLLFVVPIVAIIGNSLGRSIRGQTELGVALACVGLAVTVATVVRRIRHAAWHSIARPWRLVREARQLTDSAKQ